MKLTPLHDWAVILPSEGEGKSVGGLYIPDTAKEKPHEGIVEAIGPGAYEPKKYGEKKPEKERKYIPTTIKPGDRVLYEQYGGQKITVNGEERMLVRERDILGTVIGKPASTVPAAAGERSLSPVGAKEIQAAKPASVPAPQKAETRASAVKPAQQAKKAAKKPAGKASPKAKKASTKKKGKKK